VITEGKFFGVHKFHCVGWVDWIDGIINDKLIAIVFGRDKGNTKPNLGPFFSICATICTIFPLKNMIISVKI